MKNGDKMKKRMLRVLVLCVVVFSLAGCSSGGNVENTSEVTLETGFKGGNATDFETFKQSTIDSSGGVVTEVDVVDNEILIISENDAYNTDEATKKTFIESMDKQVKPIADALTSQGAIETIDTIVKDYTGDTVVTYIYKTTDGTEVYKFSINKEGLVDNK